MGYIYLIPKNIKILYFGTESYYPLYSENIKYYWSNTLLILLKMKVTSSDIAELLHSFVVSDKIYIGDEENFVSIVNECNIGQIISNKLPRQIRINNTVFVTEPELINFLNNNPCRLLRGSLVLFGKKCYIIDNMIYIDINTTINGISKLRRYYFVNLQIINNLIYRDTDPHPWFINRECIFDNAEFYLLLNKSKRTRIINGNINITMEYDNTLPWYIKKIIKNGWNKIR